MSKKIAVGIALVAITAILGLGEFTECEFCYDLDKVSTIIGGAFIGGIGLIVIGYKDRKRFEFFDEIDEAKEKILKDIKKTLDKL